MKEIEMTVDKINGKSWEVSRVCNLSSVPKWAISKVTNRLVDSANNITVLSYQLRASVDDLSMKKRFHKRIKDKVTMIVDSDDKHYMDKIKNVCFMNSWKNQGVIKIKMCTSTNKPRTLLEGKMGIRIANHNHTRTIMKMITSRPLNQADLNCIISSTVVRTYDDRAGSISGLTYILGMFDIPYIIEDCVIRYNESWLTTKKLLHRCDIITNTSTSDYIPDGELAWQYKTGYGDLVMTNNGIKMAKIAIKSTSTKKDQKNKRSNWIIRMFKKLCSKIRTVIIWIKEKVMKTNGGKREGTKENDTNSRKENKQENNNNNQQSSSSGTTSDKAININEKSKAKKDREMSRGNSKKIYTDKKENKVTTNSAVYLGALNVASSMAMTYQRSKKSNAASEIKKANKLIADVQLAKMQVRTGLLGDKSLSQIKRSDAMNAYIVGTTAYNVNDATVNANQLAVKKKVTVSDNILLLFTFAAVALMILMNNGLLAIIVGSIGVISYMVKDINRTSAVFAITALASMNIPLILLASIIAMIEEISLNKDTETMRNVLYTVLSCLIII